jgi:hypothetical protein
MEDVTILLRLHDRATGGARGRPPRVLEVFKRAGVILAVTAWESYIEDALRRVFTHRLNMAKDPSEVASAFASAAQGWLSSQDKRPKPTELAAWTGKKWKKMIRDAFERDITDLNTPDARNIRRLSRTYIGTDITEHWRWRRVSSDSAAAKLRLLIDLRGRLVHRGRDLFESRQAARRLDLTSAIGLVRRLVVCTSRVLAHAQTRPTQRRPTRA